MIDGAERVLYDGYWIKTYPVPADTLEAKKRLIEGLTRRLFNHTEHGLDIPGTRLNEAKASHEAETDPARKRVKAAMLAGAYFNRATDIFRKLVELQADGVEIRSDDALMRECGKCLLDAMELGRFVLHRQGRDLFIYIARARTPMPKSTREYIERCTTYLRTGRIPLTPVPLPA